MKTKRNYEVTGEYSTIRDYQEDMDIVTLGIVEAYSENEAREIANTLPEVISAKKSPNLEGIYLNIVYQYEVAFVLYDEEFDDEPELNYLGVLAYSKEDAQARVEKKYAHAFDFRGVQEVKFVDVPEPARRKATRKEI